MTDEEKIKKWEEENSFLANILQKECLNYEHYKSEVLEDIEQREVNKCDNFQQKKPENY